MTNIYPNWTNVTDLAQTPGLANIVTGGLFWITMLFIIALILFMILNRYGSEVSLLLSSFLSLMIGYFMLISGLINPYYYFIFLAVCVIMAVIIYWGGNKSER